MTQYPSSRFRDPNGPAIEQEPPPATADLRDLVAILRARWLWIAASLLVALALAAAYLATTTTTYTATVSVLIDARSRAPVGADASVLPYSPDALLVESQVKVIASDAVLRRVVRDQKLDADPEIVNAAPGLLSRLSSLLHKPVAGTATDDDKVTAALKALARAIVVKRSDKTYVIDVDVSWRDPVQAARLANAVATAYIEDQRGASAASAQRDLAMIDDRLVTLQKKVKDSETAVAQYRAAHRITDANGKSIGEQELADIATDLGRARSRVAELKGKADQLHKIVASGRTPDATADAMSSPTLDKLRSQYADIARQEANLRTTLGDMHPALREVRSQSRDTQRLIGEELRRVVAAADNDVGAAQATERDIAQRYEAARRALDTQGQAMVRLRELDRDADASRTAYERYLRAREATSDNADTVSARVIAPALIPSAPSAPKRTAILAIALAGGLFVGAGLAFASDLFSQRPDAPTPERPGRSRVSRTIFGAVPRFDPRRLRDGARRLMRSRNQEARDTVVPVTAAHLASAAPVSSFSAAVDELRTALIEQSRRHRLRTLLITSVEPGVGKTTIARHLAKSVAQAGLRVLLVDANPQRPSLDDLVAAEAPVRLARLFGVNRAVYSVATEGAGSLSVSPARQEDVAADGVIGIDALADAYDLVVVDGPVLDDIEPRAAFSDAIDSVVMVVRDDSQPLQTLADGLHTRNISRRKFTGAVVSMTPQAA